MLVRAVLAMESTEAAPEIPRCYQDETFRKHFFKTTSSYAYEPGLSIQDLYRVSVDDHLPDVICTQCVVVKTTCNREAAGRTLWPSIENAHVSSESVQPCQGMPGNILLSHNVVLYWLSKKCQQYLDDML